MGNRAHQRPLGVPLQRLSLAEKPSHKKIFFARAIEVYTYGYCLNNPPLFWLLPLPEMKNKRRFAMCEIWGVWLKKLTCVPAVGAALLMTHPAFAASAVASACAADIKALCADVTPGGGALKDCVKAHFSALSADCQVAIVRAAAVGRACRVDAQQFCADVRPGIGALSDCMKAHAASVSDDCRAALAKANGG